MRHNLTEAEIRLWNILRATPFDTVHFRRQHAIGPFIVDFCASRQKLITEVDGSQHIEQQEYDTVRTNFLESHGYRVLRFWNDEVMKDQTGVALAIMDALGLK